MMASKLSRRSIIAAGISAFALAGVAEGSGVSAQLTGSSESTEGMFESSLFGDVVTWDEDKMSIRANLSGPGQSADAEWDKVTLGMHPELSTGLAVVTFQELPFATLEEMAAEYPEAYWGEGWRDRVHDRGVKLTEEALGWFYVEDDTQGTGAHYCGYKEFVPPSAPGGVWCQLGFSTNVTYEEFDFDILAANGDAFEINGNPVFQAWTFDEVLAAFAEEMDAAGV